MSLTTAAIPSLSSLDMYGVSSSSYLSSLANLASLSSWSTHTYNNLASYNISTSSNTSTSPYNGFCVDYDSLNVKNKFTVAGIDVVKLLTTIADRLYIVHDTSKHDKFAALRRAYENYKVIEAMCVTNNLSA